MSFDSTRAKLLVGRWIKECELTRNDTTEVLTMFPELLKLWQERGNENARLRKEIEDLRSEINDQVESYEDRISEGILFISKQQDEITALEEKTSKLESERLTRRDERITNSKQDWDKLHAANKQLAQERDHAAWEANEAARLLVKVSSAYEKKILELQANNGQEAPCDKRYHDYDGALRARLDALEPVIKAALAWREAKQAIDRSEIQEPLGVLEVKVIELDAAITAFQGKVQ